MASRKKSAPKRPIEVCRYKEGWAKLVRNLKAEVDEERIEACPGIESLRVIGLDGQC